MWHKLTKLNLLQTYHQLPLDEASRKLTTISTPNGLYEYLRLPFGISSVVGIFQCIMTTMLKGLECVCVYLNDFLVTGKTLQAHMSNLRALLQRLRENGVTLKKDKCEFFLLEVQYLGFRVSKEGLKPIESKVRAIKEAKAPKCLSELQSFIGAVNYYSHFQPNLAPLYKLLQKSQKWQWTNLQQEANRCD